MPSSSHTHKSMLLRGVKLPTPVLTRSDIEILRSKSQKSGRSYGGVPLKNNPNGGRRDTINYAAGGPPPGQGGHGRGPYQQPDRGYANGYGGGYGSGYGGGYGGYGGQYQQYAPPPPTWQPPPPGYPGFGVGMPPPPPPAHLAGGGYGQGYGGQGYGHGYRNDRYEPGPPPHGGYQRSHQGYQGQHYRPPPPPGQDRRYDRSYGGDSRDRSYRDSRGYR